MDFESELVVSVLGPLQSGSSERSCLQVQAQPASRKLSEAARSWPQEAHRGKVAWSAQRPHFKRQNILSTGEMNGRYASAAWEFFSGSTPDLRSYWSTQFFLGVKSTSGLNQC